MEWWVSGADCGVSKGWPRCEGGPGNASFVLPSSADLFINKVVVVLSVRVPASVGVPTAQPRCKATVSGVRGSPSVHLHPAVTNRHARVRRRHQ